MQTCSRTVSFDLSDTSRINLFDRSLENRNLPKGFGVPLACLEHVPLFTAFFLYLLVPLVGYPPYATWRLILCTAGGAGNRTPVQTTSVMLSTRLVLPYSFNCFLPWRRSFHSSNSEVTTHAHWGNRSVSFEPYGVAQTCVSVELFSVLSDA